MRILSVVHGPEARAELFEPVVVRAGHALDEWSFSWGRRPPRPLDSYDAYMVFGGAMHPDQEAQHTWLPEEIAWLEQVIADRRPVLGVCLGVQLLARAAGAQVRRLDEPEIGWIDIELNEAGAEDPVLGSLPRALSRARAGTTTRTTSPTARSSSRAPTARRRRSGSATRAGACSSIPEVTALQLDRWTADFEDPPPDPDGLRAETQTHIGAWNELGRTLCSAFLDAAERVQARAA